MQHYYYYYYYIPYLYSTLFYIMFKSALQYRTYKRKMLKWHGIIYIKCKIKYYNIVVINLFDVIVRLKNIVYLQLICACHCHWGRRVQACLRCIYDSLTLVRFWITFNIVIYIAFLINPTTTVLGFGVVYLVSY